MYGVGESGSTLADPNTGPCWSLLLLFSLSEWRLRLILQPSPTSCTILDVLPSTAGGRLTVREQLPRPALQPVSLLPRRKPACVVTRKQSLEKTKIQSKPCFDIVIWMQAMLVDTSTQASRMRRLSFLNSAELEEGGELPLILSPNYPPPNVAQTHTKPHVENIKSEFQSSNQELSTSDQLPLTA